ncbi:class I SAM-dependent methyltransferase [Pusillimonas sp.]|uniref:class I SAM-dependent methyltransferase n=1 Tax=Pusillimonas sp. TaxID=3040095 RepID=UPI0029A8205D|nr:class I SAM-dependent methyltransferase [Pusillimonas sp.]MDX3893739.1 class I SAM-dependent methyltransferase [Pusillimonas sp.]
MQAQPGTTLVDTERALVRLALAARELGYRFITPTPATHERVNSRPGNEWAHDLRGVLGWSRPFQPQLLPGEIFALMQQAQILSPVEGGWKSRLRLSSLDGQLYWHSAYPTTEADAVFLGPDTYRFVQAIKHYLDSCKTPIARAFDIGCGTGAGALSIALNRPAAQIWAGDINASALRLARVNSAVAGADNMIACQSDMLGGATGAFDLIVANPPYLNDSMQRAYRHGGGSHGQELAAAMLAAALPRLAPGGTMLLYTGTAFVEGRDTFLEAAGRVLDGGSHKWRWSYREMDPDVFGEELDSPAYQDAERIAAVVLQVGSR